MRRILILALVAFLIACSPVDEIKAATAVNSFRATTALAPLVRSAPLDRNAKWQAARMAREQRVFHTKDLASVGSPGWSILGENVASATTIAAAIAALEQSAPHRANLLEPRFKRFGVAVVTRNGVVYLVQLFEG